MANFVVELQFGSSQTRSEVYENEDDSNRYEFDSKEELKAFMSGVNEAIGWMEYANITFYKDGEEIHTLR